MSELMRHLSRLFLIVMLAAVLLGLASPPSNAARRIASSPYAGLGVWRSTPYEGTADPFASPCGLSVAAFIQKTNATALVAVAAVTAEFAWPSRVSADRLRAPAGCRAIPAQEVGGDREENAPAVGQPRAARAITERWGPKSRLPL